MTQAGEDAKSLGALAVPLHLRNAPTPMMKGLGYGKGYKYAHDFEGALTTQDHLPEKLSGWPCVKWPPCARFIPKIVSPGLSTLKYAA